MPITNVSGPLWYVVFRNPNDAIRVYERTIPGPAATVGAAKAEPAYTARTLPALTAGR